MDTPTHHIHNENELLPASGTGEGTVDYSAENIDRLADQDMYPAARENTTTTTHHNTHSPSHIPGRASLGTDDANRQAPPDIGTVEYPPKNYGETKFNERPGLSSDDSAKPQAKPGIGDKIIGKTEQLAGGIIRNQELKTKGEIRAEIGKV